VVPAINLDFNRDLVPSMHVNKDRSHVAETKAMALCTLCWHMLYNGRWNTGRPGYFLKYLKNTKELVVTVPLNQKVTVGRAISIMHRSQTRTVIGKCTTIGCISNEVVLPLVDP
jgi:serine acetyltransferase